MPELTDAVLANYEHAATWQELLEDMHTELSNSDSPFHGRYNMETVCTIIDNVVGTTPIPLSDSLGAFVMLMLHSLLTIAESQDPAQLDGHKQYIKEMIDRVN